MVTDETGVVVSANAVNTDGEVVLSEVELEGKTAEEAVVDFTETAVDLGFMDPEAGKDTVYVDVNGENAEVVENVKKSVSDKLMKFFEKKGITGKVSEEVLNTYLEAAEEWDVTPGHAKMIARVLEANPELTYDELLNLTVKELIELLKTNVKDNNVSADLKKDYNDAVKALKEEYKELFELREAIDEIEDELEDAREEDDDDDDDDDDDEKLTEEEIAALEAELAEKKAAAEALEKEYKEKLEALKAEYKVSSDKAREEHKKEAEERKEAKKEGKPFENKRTEKPAKPDHDDDDDEDDDEDEDEKRPENKDEDNKGKGDKADKEDKDDNEKKEHTEKPRHEHDDDEDEEDDD